MFKRFHFTCSSLLIAKVITDAATKGKVSWIYPFCIIYKLIKSDNNTAIEIQTASLSLFPAKAIAVSTALKLSKPFDMFSTGISKFREIIPENIAAASPYKAAMGE